MKKKILDLLAGMPKVSDLPRHLANPQNDIPLIVIVNVFCEECGKANAMERAGLTSAEAAYLVEPGDCLIERIGIRRYLGERPWAIANMFPAHPHPVTITLNLGRDDLKGPMEEMVDMSSPWKIHPHENEPSE